MPTCQHKFVYAGVRVQIIDVAVAGTSAKPRNYYHWFYCEKCTIPRFQQFEHNGPTYEQIKYGATPVEESTLTGHIVDSPPGL